jgi:hypothetical protein
MVGGVSPEVCMYAIKQSRRELLLQAMAGMLAGPSFVTANPTEVQAEANRRIARLIEQYDLQGIHRTGAAGDKRSADWLAAEASKLGVKPTLEPFALDRVDPLNCFIEIGAKRIEGLPLFDAAFTDAYGVRGKLGVFGGATEIGMIELPPSAEYDANYETTRRASRHRALLIITKGARAGLCPINCAYFKHPFGPPALQVGSEHGEWLKQQARHSAPARIVAHVKRTKTKAYNVTATIKGAQPRLAPLVVMTPRSGWWRSTSERGGGLVCWLEVMRALTAKRPARTAHFISSSGHELGHLGLASFIERRPELVKQAQAWVHFGANIGAVGAPNRLQAFDDELEEIAVGAMAKADLTVHDKAKRGAAPLGEAGNIHRDGGRYVSLLCPGNPLFHHPADRWPDAVDVGAVAHYAEAFAGVASILTGG